MADALAAKDSEIAALSSVDALTKQVALSEGNLALLQRTADEKTTKAAKLEQKVALLEVECASLKQELQGLEARARRGQEKSPEEANQTIQGHMEVKKLHREPTDLSYNKQTQLETMASEKAAAEFQLEEIKCLQESQVETERITVSRRASLSWEEDTDMKALEPIPLYRRHSVGASMQLQKAAKRLGSGAVKATRFLWRFPAARLLLLFYLVLVHLFLMDLLHRLQRKGLGVLRVSLSSSGCGIGGGGGGERESRVAMESTLKDARDGAAAVDVDPKQTAGGGVGDVYGEDRATEDQIVTPWATYVASGFSLLRDPHYNKGLAFNEKERDAHYLRGLLPPVVFTQQLQEKKMMHIIHQYEVPLQKYMAMMDLQERNEMLFYKLLIDNVEELLPVVYTPTVGEACQKYGSIYRRPQGLYISLKEKGKILELLKNWPERSIQVIVVTDGERILGLGDLGCQGMGIPVGKLALYAALGGVRPSACLPVTIDVGTNNEQLLKDEFYIGLRQRRATGKEYDDLLHEFMTAVKQNYGEKVLIQFEDFANHNAFKLLAKYGTTHLTFNDDIQGTASVVLAGLLAALKLLGGTFANQTFLFLGAGEAGTGIAELLALEISKQTKAPLEEARKKIWLVDSKGLIVSSRKDSLQHFKKPWAHEHEPVKDLLDAIKAIKPTVLIGSSGVGKTFTKVVIEALASFNEKPLILALSNPTSQSECTAEEAYTWSQGRAIFASGSPFDPVEYNGVVYVPGQANNAYIFPGFGLGLVMSGAIRVHDEMLLAASEALAEEVTKENFDKGLIYPPLSNIRKISAHIAANVAAKAYELGVATRLPRPENLVKYAESCMYTPNYRSYR